MSILNKTRFLLVSTALVAALHAQGINPEPVTTVSQPTRVAPTQPQAEIREFFQAVPSDVMVKIAQHLPPKDCLNLSCTKKKIQTAVAPVLSRQREIRYIVKQANEKYTYDNFLRAIETEQGQQIMETLVLGGKGLKVRTGTFTQHQDLLTPYVTFYSRAKGDPIAPGDILILCPHLIELNLVNNQIDVAGAQAMAGALEKNTILTKLNLVDNRIGVVGAQAIAGTLEKNRALTTLNLESNLIASEGAESIAKLLKVNTTLANLNLANNRIIPVGAQALWDAIDGNKQLPLKTLNLSYNYIPEDIQRKFRALAQERGFKVQL